MFKLIKKKIKDEIAKIVLELLQDENIQFKLWQATNKSSDFEHYSEPLQLLKLSDKAFDIAATESAIYILENMSEITPYRNKRDLLKNIVPLASPEGLFLEFGVERGFSINIIANIAQHSIIHGFDSFQGLPENWGPNPAGTYSTNGILPQVRENVKLHIGWFSETIPEFLKNHKGFISFMNIDSCLYFSTETIFRELVGRLRKGTIIFFSTYFNYPNWKVHVYKAFQEFIKKFDIKYDYLGYTDYGHCVALQIKDIKILSKNQSC